MKLRIATRKSPLALWQARHVGQAVAQLVPGLEVELVELSTEGDRFLQAPLSQIGGKGLFVKEIEQALLDDRADVAVHSLKDMTSLMPESLCLAAVPEREDPRDAWVARAGADFATLPPGARVGTSSLRRTCQLLERRPDLLVVSLRGNVQTRLRRMEEAALHGTVLAAAGLKRLGLSDRITELLPVEVSLPSVGQGVLAIQCRKEDLLSCGWVARLEHRATRIAILAERAFLARLEGGCSVPLAAYAEVRGDEIHLRGLVGSPDGKRMVRAERRGPVRNAEALGLSLAEVLLAEGASEILRDFAHSQAAGR